MLTAERKRGQAGSEDAHADDDVELEEYVDNLPITVTYESETDWSDEEFQKWADSLPYSDIDYPEEYLKELDREIKETEAKVAAGEVIKMTAEEFDELMEMPKAERRAALVRKWKAMGK